MIIYKITNLLNGKIYIGQTVQALRIRWRNHVNTTNSKSTCYLHNAIKKFGQDSFKIEAIDEAQSLDELNTKEQTYIKAFNSLAPNGYNLKLGGDNHQQHPETRQRMSISAKKRILETNGEQFAKIAALGREALKGKDPWNKGIKASEEAIKNQSIAHQGQKAWNKGQQTALETREKQRLAKLAFSKRVFCPELEKEWVSIEAAAREVDISPIHIKRLAKSGKKSGRGLSFRLV